MALPVRVSSGNQRNSVTKCKNLCESKNLFRFELEDYYNYADRLNQSNFLRPREGKMNTKNDTLIDKGELQDFGASCGLTPITTSNVRFWKTYSEVGAATTDLCTNIDFDFARREWTDEKSLEDSYFIKKWKSKFGSLWNSFGPGVYPPQPFQPEFVLIKLRLEARTVDVKHWSVDVGRKSFQLFYQCRNNQDWCHIFYIYFFLGSSRCFKIQPDC